MDGFEGASPVKVHRSFRYTVRIWSVESVQSQPAVNPTSFKLWWRVRLWKLIFYYPLRNPKPVGRFNENLLNMLEHVGTCCNSADIYFLLPLSLRSLRYSVYAQTKLVSTCEIVLVLYYYNWYRVMKFCQNLDTYGQHISFSSSCVVGWWRTVIL